MKYFIKENDFTHAWLNGSRDTPIPVQERVFQCCCGWLHLRQFLLILCGLLLNVSLTLMSNYPIQSHNIQVMVE